MLKKIVLSTFVGLVLSASVAYARADEMSWDMKTSAKSMGHVTCKLADGMTLRHGQDFVETKRLVCWRGTDLIISQTVTCGPEGSRVKFGRGKGKVIVTCRPLMFAKK